MTFSVFLAHVGVHHTRIETAVKSILAATDSYYNDDDENASRRDDDEEEAAAPVAIEGVRNHPTGHGVDVRWQSALLQHLPNFFIRITPLSSLVSCP